jgi:hypothetical protein
MLLVKHVGYKIVSMRSKRSPKQKQLDNADNTKFQRKALSTGGTPLSQKHTGHVKAPPPNNLYTFYILTQKLITCTYFTFSNRNRGVKNIGEYL